MTVKNIIPIWQLNDLYQKIDDPRREHDWKALSNKVKRFNSAYSSEFKTSTIDSKKLLVAICDLEDIYSLNAKILAYSSLSHSVNSRDSKIARAYQQDKEMTAHLESQLIWFEQLLKTFDKRQLRLILKSKSLIPYRYFLTHSAGFKKYILTDLEEKLLVTKSQSGSSAFIRLYDELSSSKTFQIMEGKKTKTVTLPQITNQMSYHENRQVRQTASSVYAKSFDQEGHLYSYILNTLLLDHAQDMQLRHANDPREIAFLEQDTPAKMVDNMIGIVTTKYPIVAKYYTKKSKLINATPLHEWDRYVSLGNINPRYSFIEAKEIILGSFYRFSNDFGRIAQLFFENSWIDAKVRLGKSGGGFCSSASPKHHAYILVNYQGTIRDVMTLAHELGHGVHAYLSARQSFFNFHPSIPMAEIASVFAEMLVFNDLMDSFKSPKQKQILLGQKIEEIFATVFRQTALYLFELDIHTHRKTHGELSRKEFDHYWQKRLQKMFGDSLQLTPNHANSWMPILHFYHYNFYVYSYVFGQLISFALYAELNSGDKTFIKRYAKLLSAGGSDSPTKLLKGVGIDLDNNSAWDHGLRYIELMVKRFIVA